MKKWKSFGAIAMVGGLLCTMLTGCGNTSAAKVKIGYSNNSEQDGFRMSIMQAMEKYVAEDSQYEIVFKDAENDSKKQNEQIGELLDEDIDIMVISAIDSEKICSAIEECNIAGIPVICVNERAKTDCVYAGSENYHAGYMQGELFAEMLPPDATLVYMEGPAGAEASVSRKKGAQDALVKAGRTDVQFIASQDCEWSRETGKSTMKQWILKYANGTGGVTFNGVIAANDEMALGAMDALTQAGISVGSNGILISGVDGTADGLKAIKDGKMIQTVLQDADGQAKGAFEAVQIFATGGQPDDDILIAFQSITSENIGEYV